MSSEETVQLPVVYETKPLPTDKYHVSYSEIVDWLECSFRHKLKHIQKLDFDKPTEHTEFGGIIHDAIEHYLMTGEPLDPVATSLKVREMLSKMEGFTGDADTWAASVEPIFQELPGFLADNFSNYKLIAAEQQLMENVAGKKERFFKGFIDCVVEYDKLDMRKKEPVAEREYYVIDWKTSSWGWTGEKKRDPVKQMQLVFYKHFWCLKNNVPLDKVKCAWVILKRDAKPGNHIELVPVSVGPKAVEKALQTLNQMIASIEKGLFVKNRNSCKYCPYKNTSDCP